MLMYHFPSLSPNAEQNKAKKKFSKKKQRRNFSGKSFMGKEIMAVLFPLLQQFFYFIDFFSISIQMLYAKATKVVPGWDRWLRQTIFLSRRNFK